jgi:hypothetical protein
MKTHSWAFCENGKKRMGKLFALALLSSLALMGEDRWLRFSSEHFEIFSNAGAGTGREVLRRFEQIRHVFEAKRGAGI